MSKMCHKQCGVPKCRNSNFRTPDKLFFRIPPGEIRKQWCKVMSRDLKRFKPLPLVSYCCEDHFDLPQDMYNYWRWKIYGGKPRIQLNKGVLPHKFECQVSRGSTSSPKKRKQIETPAFDIKKDKADVDAPSRKKYNFIKHKSEFDFNEKLDTQFLSAGQKSSSSEVYETHLNKIEYESDSSGEFEILL